MIAGDINNFTKLRPNKIVEKLINYISEELVNFNGSQEFLSVLEKKKNENQHSLSPCLYFTNKCKSKFYFARENSQAGSSTIDIGVYYGDNIIYTIEAKVLPTPKGSKKQPRDEHEYVFGRGAGIQRFKEGKHGLNNRDEVIPMNGMIAYIKESNFNYWHEKINKWIIDAPWDKTEQLKIIHLGAIGKLESNHKLKDNTYITLHHFWVNV